jgi:hypothetical protein
MLTIHNKIWDWRKTLLISKLIFQKKKTKIEHDYVQHQMVEEPHEKVVAQSGHNPWETWIFDDHHKEETQHFPQNFFFFLPNQVF